MSPVNCIQGSVEVNIIGSHFRLPLDEDDFTLGPFFQSVGNNFSVSLGIDSLGWESLSGREFHELIFQDVLGMVEVGEEFWLILDVASDDGRIGIKFLDFLLSFDIIFLWIGKSIVIILERGSKEQVRPLYIKEQITCFPYSATSFINLVLEVTL